MTSGTILTDTQFLYSDGTTGKKILIVLNDGEVGHYIVIKTTSKDTYKGLVYGCQSHDRYPNFYLPKGSCCLRKHTWALLDQFFEFDRVHMLTHGVSGRIRQIGVLPTAILKELLICAAECEDITQSQAMTLRDTHRSLA